jgi:hypothetical protein
MSSHFAGTRQHAPTLALLLALMLFGGRSAEAAPILDQQYTAIGTGSVIVSASQSIAQTFTVGMEGLLTSVEVQVARRAVPPDSDLILSIVNAATGTLTDVLATVAIDPSEVSTSFAFLAVDLSSFMLDVEVGQRLAIRLTTASPGTGGGINPYAWFGDFPGTYVGGTAFINNNPSLQRDMAFRTFVDPQAAAIPEPASLALVAVGLLGGASRWARRRRRSTDSFNQ